MSNQEFTPQVESILKKVLIVKPLGRQQIMQTNTEMKTLSSPSNFSPLNSSSSNSSILTPVPLSPTSKENLLSTTDSLFSPPLSSDVETINVGHHHAINQAPNQFANASHNQSEEIFD